MIESITRSIALTTSASLMLCCHAPPGLAVIVDPLGIIVTIPLPLLGGDDTIPHHERDAGTIPGEGKLQVGAREGRKWEEVGGRGETGGEVEGGREGRKWRGSGRRKWEAGGRGETGGEVEGGREGRKWRGNWRREGGEEMEGSRKWEGGEELEGKWEGGGRGCTCITAQCEVCVQFRSSVPSHS